MKLVVNVRLLPLELGLRPMCVVSSVMLRFEVKSGFRGGLVLPQLWNRRDTGGMISL